MKLLVFMTILLIFLIQQNKSDKEIGESEVQELVAKFLQNDHGTARAENITCPPIDPTLIKFHLYTPKNKLKSVLLIAGEVNDLSLFDPTLETKLMVPGWLDNTKVWLEGAKDKYLRVGNYNIILLNWSEYNLKPYLESVCYIKQIAKTTANLLIQIKNETKLDLKKTHVIGHSLGGQLSGLIGQNIQELTGGEKLRRITGLDSAGPSFCHPFVVNDDERITADDADYVDAIHTCDSYLGCEASYGSANFFPNCGIVQNGCAFLNSTLPGIKQIQGMCIIQRIPLFVGICSHLRAFKYWIESIDSDGFKASPCEICATNTSVSCGKAGLEIMGEHSSSLAKGNYYLTTQSLSPFAKG